MALLGETREAEAETVAERIRLAVTSEPVATSHEPVSISVTASGGLVSTEIVSLDEIVASLNPSLRIRRSRIRSLDGSTDTGESQVELGKVLSNLSLHLGVARQGIVRLSTREPVGFELLSRISLPQFQNPLDLFRQANAAGRLSNVDLLCLRHCLKAASTLPKGTVAHFNVYPTSLIGLRSDALAELVELAGGLKLCAEISEQQLLGDLDSLRAGITTLRDFGIRVALDDVGFGRTSLESLISLEPDTIKLDRKCLTDAPTEVARRKSLTRLLRVARALSEDVIAEGVETEDQRLELLDLGIVYGQGFLFDRPVLMTDVPKPLIPVTPVPAERLSPSATDVAKGVGVEATRPV